MRGAKIKVVADQGYIDERNNMMSLMVRKDLYKQGRITQLIDLKDKK